MRYKRYIFYLCFFASSLLSAQENLIEDSTFFKVNIKTYENWLDKDLASTLSIDTLEILENYVILTLNIDSLKTWVNLKHSFYEENRFEITEILFSKLIFIMEIEKNQGGIKIQSKDGHNVLIGYKQGIFTVNEDVYRDIEYDKIKLPINKVKGIENDEISNNETLELVRQKISIYFSDFYSIRNGIFSEYEPDFEVYEDDDKIFVEIKNIKREILNDYWIGYYELIQIEIFLEKKEDSIFINYNLQGKYGSGIFVAPRKSGYVSMETDYKEYLTTYNRKMKANLRKYLLR